MDKLKHAIVIFLFFQKKDDIIATHTYAIEWEVKYLMVAKYIQIILILQDLER